jgi:hypothetical protein
MMSMMSEKKTKKSPVLMSSNLSTQVGSIAGAATSLIGVVSQVLSSDVVTTILGNLAPALPAPFMGFAVPVAAVLANVLLDTTPRSGDSKISLLLKGVIEGASLSLHKGKNARDL